MTTSKVRLRKRDEREKPKRRTPSIVIPSTLSNSTAVPTTSNIRGSTLTLTPTALAMRITSTTPLVSVVVGAMMIRCTLSSWTRCRMTPGLSTQSSASRASPASGIEAMTEARARLAASFSRIRSTCAASPITRQRSSGETRPATARASTRPLSIATNAASHNAAIWSANRVPPSTTVCRLATPSAKRPVSCASTGSSSSVECTSRKSSRS